MTRDEILKMPAGREIDALVATEIFGVEVEFEKIAGEPYAKGKGYSIPQYSYRISDAWDVVEKLAGEAEEIDVAHSMDGWTCLLWFFRERSRIHALADTAPLAICRAALLAVLC